MLFQVLADGPGEAVGSGGRYDRLFDRFGGAREAAGFAIDLGNLGWALDRAGTSAARRVRVLLSSSGGASVAAIAGELRRLGVPCAEAPESSYVEYARAWRFSHVLEVSAAGVTLLDVEAGTRRLVGSISSSRDAASSVVALVGSSNPKSEGT
jgi:ATP phosphoribosyltransferase regulatory subunit